MNPTTNTNQRLIIALLIALAILFVLLAIGIVAVFIMMSGGRMGMGGGMMNGMIMNDIYAAYTKMTSNFR